MTLHGFSLKEVNNMGLKTQGIPHNANITSEKAKKILREGEIGGKAITKKQKRFFGFVAGGGRPTRV